MTRSLAIIAACTLLVLTARAGQSVADVSAPASQAAPTPCPKPGDPIAIQSVQLSENPIRAGTSVSGVVLATCNVAAVTAQVGTFRVGLPKTSPGVFRTTISVPHFVMPGHFDLVITAIRTDGATVQTHVPIVLRW